MDYDYDKVDDMTLALMCLTFVEGQTVRTVRDGINLNEMLSPGLQKESPSIVTMLKECSR